MSSYFDDEIKIASIIYRTDTFLLNISTSEVVRDMIARYIRDQYDYIVNLSLPHQIDVTRSSREIKHGVELGGVIKELEIKYTLAYD